MRFLALLGWQVAVVSGTAGLRGAAERTQRAARDCAAAAALRAGGSDAFVAAWYRAPLWARLRAHPRCALRTQKHVCGVLPNLAPMETDRVLSPKLQD